ncbi:lipid IV(A) 3-deoxy-D-manno-octulosonic acid transferase [Kistimonas scapharcae]|uniref:3-deoxy-D-manno-octulosonic acid transferase n=1 Tax=Kistimonas scapharcae TaxID=1036133 RepID=A0ABP8UX27_9GAMM
MPRLIYTLVYYLLLPLIILRLLYRAWKAPAYARRWNERFGFFKASNPPMKSIWVHSVSVGETIAATPLVNALKTRYPDHRIVVTTMTPTGSDRVRAIHGDSVFHVYVPYDLPGAVNRFLDRITPELAIIMETELWPNTIAACHKRHIPTLLTNARLSERSARGYAKLGPLTRGMLQQLSFIAAQAKDDAERFIQLGHPRCQTMVTGTLKYDLNVEKTLSDKAKVLRAHWLSERLASTKILIAASTHKGEEEQILSAFEKVRGQHKDTLLLLVPRHPERFNDVHALITSQNLSVARRSSNEPVTASTDVILGDTMGEMMLLFSASDISFIGGSLVPVGGHNLLEPAAVGLPVISGPHLFNFADVATTLKAANALSVVNNQEELADRMITLLDDEALRKSTGQAGKRVVEQNRGALEKQLTLAASLMH